MIFNEAKLALQMLQILPVLTPTSVGFESYESKHNECNSINQQYVDKSIDQMDKNMKINNDIPMNRNSLSRSRDRRNENRSGSRGLSFNSDRRNARKDRHDIQELSLDGNESTMENNLMTHSDHQLLKHSDVAGSNINSKCEENDLSSKMMSNEIESVIPLVSFRDVDERIPNFKHTHQYTNKSERPFSLPQSFNSGCCVRLTCDNKNVLSTHNTIRRFFHGLKIPRYGIKILRNENGIRTNEVVIRFAGPQTARNALAWAGKVMNGNIVDVISITDFEYDNERDY